jgi:queuine tRNA-ribosyltransferase
VVQGGADPELRRLCARELAAMGFDGYCYGGWPFDSQGRMLADILALTAELLPSDKPRYALGIGNPSALIACARMGYDLFDCALPTRDARRGRLYVFGDAGELSHDRLYIRDGVNRRDRGPVSDACDCLCCRSYSRAYLHHLFAVGDSLAWRLATVHNLRFYTALIERLRSRGG